MTLKQVWHSGLSWLATTGTVQEIHGFLSRRNYDHLTGILHNHTNWPSTIICKDLTAASLRKLVTSNISTQQTSLTKGKRKDCDRLCEVQTYRKARAHNAVINQCRMALKPENCFHHIRNYPNSSRNLLRPATKNPGCLPLPGPLPGWTTAAA